MIRCATLDDLEFCFTLAQEFRSSVNDLFELDKDKISTIISNGSVFVSDNGMIAAQVIEPMFSSEKYMVEIAWFVREGCRGEGLKLYKCLENHAKDMGCTKIVMVAINNQVYDKVVSLYKRMGFSLAESNFIRGL